MSELKTNLRDTFIGKIWKFLWVLHEEEGPQVQRYTNTCQWFLLFLLKMCSTIYITNLYLLSTYIRKGRLHYFHPLPCVKCEDNDEDIDDNHNVVYGNRLKMRIMMISLTTMTMTILTIVLCMATGHTSPRECVKSSVWTVGYGERPCCWGKNTNTVVGEKHKEDKTQTRLTKLQIKTSNIECKAKTNKQCFYWPFDFKKLLLWVKNTRKCK